MAIVNFMKRLFFGSYARGFVTSYLLFMVTGAILLKLPISIQSDQSLSWLNALFVSASALSTTGLSTIVVKDVFTLFGQTVLIMIIQFGGIGLIMLLTMFWLFIHKQIGFKERTMIMTDQNQLSRGGVVRFVRSVLLIIFTIELCGFLLMSGYFIFFTDYFTVREALFQAFFTTISLFTNAGFDIAPGGDSFQMYAHDYFIQSLGMALIFLGAVGFWPLYEVREWLIAKRHKRRYEFTLFSKILIVMHGSIWALSALLIFVLEYNHFLVDKGTLESIYYALFMSLTTRNAGFSTMEVSQFSDGIHVLFMLLMFVGSSPNSAGGGIRTTTLVLILLGIRSFARGYDQVVVKNRSIKGETVHKAYIVAFMALVLLFVNMMLLAIFEPFPLIALMFELISAFGTTGLSLGITADLGVVGRLVLLVTMFVGRVGLAALLLMFKREHSTNRVVKYPEMDIIVG